jgi:nicotinamide-nucleotide adenylyltransferase
MADDRQVGLFVGRFQPLHEGHRRVIESVTGEVDALVVVVGSAGSSHAPSDPFTGGERVEMLLRTVETAETAAPVHPVPLRDVDRNAVWVSHVRSMCPAFDVVYSHNPLVVRLFREAGVPVGTFPTFDRDRYEGTRIRRLMRTGGEWRHLVPDAAVDVIETVGGVERLRDLDAADDADADAGSVPGTPAAADGQSQRDD